jgi:hypothetical protein
MGQRRVFVPGFQQLPRPLPREISRSKRAYAAAMAGGEDKSENQDQASGEEQPQLVVGVGHFAVRVAMHFKRSKIILVGVLLYFCLTPAPG